MHLQQTLPLGYGPMKRLASKVLEAAGRLQGAMGNQRGVISKTISNAHCIVETEAPERAARSTEQHSKLEMSKSWRHQSLP